MNGLQCVTRVLVGPWGNVSPKQAVQCALSIVKREKMACLNDVSTFIVCHEIRKAEIAGLTYLLRDS